MTSQVSAMGRARFQAIAGSADGCKDRHMLDRVLHEPGNPAG